MLAKQWFLKSYETNSLLILTFCAYYKWIHKNLEVRSEYLTESFVRPRPDQRPFLGPCLSFVSGEHQNSLMSHSPCAEEAADGSSCRGDLSHCSEPLKAFWIRGLNYWKTRLGWTLALFFVFFLFLNLVSEALSSELQLKYSDSRKFISVYYQCFLHTNFYRSCFFCLSWSPLSSRLGKILWNSVDSFKIHYEYILLCK